jgi:hypothetical protein
MRFVVALAVSTACAVSLSLAASGAGPAAADTLTVTTLSSRPDMVSGGDALVEIRLGAGVPPAGVVVALNRREVSRTFPSDGSRHSLVGLVEGMPLGRNTIVGKAGSRAARLDLVNLPITGPIVSGEHLKPFVCNTVESGLGPPLDADCSAPRIEYFYKSTGEPAPAGGRGGQPSPFKPLPNPTGARPADVAQTATSEGRTVPTRLATSIRASAIRRARAAEEGQAASTIRRSGSFRPRAPRSPARSADGARPGDRHDEPVARCARR